MSDKCKNVPHLIPLGWSWSTFSTVSTIASNLVPPKDWADKPHIAPDNIERHTGRLLPFRTIAEDSVTSPKHLFKPGQLLYSKIRPYLNKCVRISFHGLCSADMYPLDAHIEAGYLHYYILSPQFVSAVTNAAGSRTVLPKTNQEQLADVPVPVAPAPEQHRIAEAIESYFTRLDDAVATLERVERNLKRYRASVLKSAVEGRLVPTEAALAKQEGRDYEPASVLLERILTERRRRWAESGKKGKYQEPMPPDTANLPELPEGWCWASPDQLASGDRYGLAIGPFGSNLRVPDYTDSGVPLIFVRNIRSERFGMDNERFVSHEKADELSAHWAYPGDVLITKMGEPPGDACIYPLSRPIAVITADCIRIRPSSLLDTSYLLYAIRSHPVQSQIQSITKGVAQKKVSLEGFRTIAVPLAPLPEQLRVAQAIERVTSIVLAATTESKAAALRCQRLRQSILKWAFEGKLADQDPSDEPASVLLERIKAERDTTQPAKKKSRA